MDYRASFDASVEFTNGGSLDVKGFRVDIPSPDTSDAEIARLFVESLDLLMARPAELANVERFAEPHKGTRGGPADRPRFVELSHVIREGMVTYPGLPEPAFKPHLSRTQSRAHYAEGTEFTIDVIEMCGNTGTYLDAPFHRYEDGGDLASISLDQTVDLPAVVVRVGDALGVDAAALADVDVTGKAVLLHTGDDVRFGTPAYADEAHFLTEDGALSLVKRGAALVGIDAINIDRVVPHGPRPAHTELLKAGIPVVEHLTGLADLPDDASFRFTAVPLRIERFGTISVRAFATL